MPQHWLTHWGSSPWAVRCWLACALLHDALFLVEVAHAVGAAHDAELTANALRFVNLNGAVGQLVSDASVGHTTRTGEFSQCWHCTFKVGFDVKLVGTALFWVWGPAQEYFPEVADGHAVEPLCRTRCRPASDATVEVSANSQAVSFLPLLSLTRRTCRGECPRADGPTASGADRTSRG